MEELAKNAENCFLALIPLKSVLIAGEMNMNLTEVLPSVSITSTQEALSYR